MARPPAIETETRLWLALDVSSLRLTDDQSLRLFSDNDEFRFEMSAAGELIIMAPASSSTDERNVTIITALRNWAKKDGTGHRLVTMRCLHYQTARSDAPMPRGLRTAAG